MQRTYGWTLGEIDGLSDGQRERIRRQWATRSIYTRAEQFLTKWRKEQAQAMAQLEAWKARTRPED
jgi:hypothetical protein